MKFVEFLGRQVDEGGKAFSINNTEILSPCVETGKSTVAVTVFRGRSIRLHVDDVEQFALYMRDLAIGGWYGIGKD